MYLAFDDLDHFYVYFSFSNAFSSTAIKIGEIQPLDDILDIALECEETGFPSRVLLRYALNYSQPFLTVLAACYKVCLFLSGSPYDKF